MDVPLPFASSLSSGLRFWRGRVAADPEGGQAWPATSDSASGSTFSLAIARVHLVSISSSKTIERSAGACSQLPDSAPAEARAGAT